MINPNARVWVYQSDKKLSDSQIDELKSLLANFTGSWTAHNQQLTATFEIRYNRFIILIVDETNAGASGCSIDKSVHFMKDIEQRYQINLFDRFNIAFKEEGEVKSVNRDAFEELIAKGLIKADSVVFNNLVQNYSQYQTDWETTLANSWHAKLFKVEA